LPCFLSSGASWGGVVAGAGPTSCRSSGLAAGSRQSIIVKGLPLPLITGHGTRVWDGRTKPEGPLAVLTRLLGRISQTNDARVRRGAGARLRALGSTHSLPTGEVADSRPTRADARVFDRAAQETAAKRDWCARVGLTTLCTTGHTIVARWYLSYT